MKILFFLFLLGLNAELLAQVDTLHQQVDSLYFEEMFEEHDLKFEHYSKRSAKGLSRDRFFESDDADAFIVDVVYEDPSEDQDAIKGPSAFDSRLEPAQLDRSIPLQQAILVNNWSIAVIVEKDMLHLIEDSVFQLDVSNTLGKRFSLCPGEAFSDQPVIGTGTGFVIGKTQMITAGHVFLGDLSNYVVVFGFEMLSESGEYQFKVHQKDIYYPRKIVYSSEEMDVAVFSVDRSFEHPPLRYSKETVVSGSLMVYMVGHPMGLPKKIALNATVQGKGEALCFFTTLDAFQGNSGSPVFRSDTHEVIGILVSGELDYEWSGSCNRSTLCSMPYCKGEKVIRIERLMAEINDNGILDQPDE